MYDYYLQDCKCVISRNYIYNLTEKFRTLKDVIKIKSQKKKIFKLIKKRKRKGNNKIIEESKEIEKEVYAVLID